MACRAVGQGPGDRVKMVHQHHPARPIHPTKDFNRPQRSYPVAPNPETQENKRIPEAINV